MSFSANAPVSPPALPPASREGDSRRCGALVRGCGRCRQAVRQRLPRHPNAASYRGPAAPAYCVGYAGCAQYGGEFDDAERCLRANWERIKGDSRLSAEQALPAVRAAWNRLVRQRRRQLPPAVNDPSFGRLRTRAAVVFSRTAPARAEAAVAAL